MRGEWLQDRHWYAMGISARHAGEWAEAFRPNGSNRPLAKEHRFLKLPTQFTSAKGGGAHANLPGDPYWHGIFDASYTRAGDYIVTPGGTFFIASQVRLAPILCIRSNRLVDFSRPALQTGVSGNPYGGFVPRSAQPLLTEWPASVSMENRYGQAEALLPTDQPLGYLSILLPAVDQVMLTTGDLMSDDLGRSAVLVATELTDLGWRLTAKAIAN